MRARRGLAAAALVLLVATGCGDDGEPVQEERPSQAASGGTGGSSGGGKRACLVVTGSGINDGGFNQSAWEGVQAGAKASGLDPRYVQADREADYLSATEAFTKQPCTIIVTTSFAMTDATKAVAQRTPDESFAIVDVTYDPPLDNVRGLVFDSGQASFLAGYLAAGMTQSGTVATFGGVKIPPVTLFMDGYADGIDYYNEKHGSEVELLGWDKGKQEGTFVGNFTDQAKGKQIARGFMDQGADIIFTLSSLPDLGAAAAIQQSGGGKVKMIWPNTDGCEERPNICDVILTSVLKNVAVATQGVTEQAAKGKFESGTYVGTLKNDGVGLAPYHEFEDAVPPELAAEVDEVRQQIIDGEIEVRSDATPSGA